MRLRFVLVSLLSAAGMAVWVAGNFVLHQTLVAWITGSTLLLLGQLLVMSVELRRSPGIPSERIVHEAERGRKLAIYDPTTGLLARWYFELRLTEETLRCQRYGLPLAMLTLTCSSNSNPAGGGWNEIARAVAGLARQTDLVGSVGFNEIGVCLIQCDLSRAGVFVRRLMIRLGENDWRIGIAVYPDDGNLPEGLMDVARRRAAPWRAGSLRAKAA